MRQPLCEHAWPPAAEAEEQEDGEEQKEEADGGGDSTARAAKWLAAALRGLKTSAAQYERKRRSAKTEILELRKEYLKYVAEHGARRAACARPLPLGCHRSPPLRLVQASSRTARTRRYRASGPGPTRALRLRTM